MDYTNEWLYFGRIVTYTVRPRDTDLGYKGTPR